MISKKQIKNEIPNDPIRAMGLYSLVLAATTKKYDLTIYIDVTVTH